MNGQPIRHATTRTTCSQDCLRDEDRPRWILQQRIPLSCFDCLFSFLGRQPTTWLLLLQMASRLLTCRSRVAADLACFVLTTRRNHQAITRTMRPQQWSCGFAYRRSGSVRWRIMGCGQLKEAELCKEHPSLTSFWVLWLSKRTASQDPVLLSIPESFADMVETCFGCFCLLYMYTYLCIHLHIYIYAYTHGVMT